MNISKHEKRVLHVLAQGGSIHFARAKNGKIDHITCFTRDGHVLTDCTDIIFKRLKKLRFIRSKNGDPYQITRIGLLAVRAQLDNR
ncbi:MAG: YjhX family toxin [Paracoccaceae bacterium]